MGRFKIKRKKTFAIILIVFVFIAGSVGASLYVLKSNQSQGLSAEQLNKKFDCDRITADFRYTDVFCSNPKFYNNPDGVTYDDYYDHLHCKDRLQNGPPAESAKNSDLGFYNAYYDCKNPTKLEQLRQDFIKDLKKLKSENE